MKIIDIHAHIYPDNIAQKATDSVKAFYDGIGDTSLNGTESMLMERGKEAGIDRFVALPVAIRPDRVQGINDYIYERAQENSRLIPFGTVHAAMDGLTDEAVMGRIPVMLHMGDQRYDYSHPIRLRRLLQLFPGLDVIAAHLGGYSMQETARELLQDTNCVMDISSSVVFMEPGVPERYINLYGAERIAFGSDYPMFDPAKEVHNFLRLKLTDDQKEQIAHKTAERILKL